MTDTWRVDVWRLAEESALRAYRAARTAREYASKRIDDDALENSAGERNAAAEALRHARRARQLCLYAWGDDRVDVWVEECRK